MLIEDIGDEILSGSAASFLEDVEECSVDSGRIKVVRQGVELVSQLHVVLNQADRLSDIRPDLKLVFGVGASVRVGVHWKSRKNSICRVP